MGFFHLLLLLLQQLYHLKSCVSLSFVFVSELQVISKVASVPLVHHLHSGSLGSLGPTRGERVFSHRPHPQKTGEMFLLRCALNSPCGPQLLPLPEEPVPARLQLCNGSQVLLENWSDFVLILELIPEKSKLHFKRNLPFYLLTLGLTLLCRKINLD